MKPINKISSDLFQKLRARFSSVTLGDENGSSTIDPSEAVFFNFVYVDNSEPVGPITISLIDRRSMKVYYGAPLFDKLKSKDEWYSFLHELRIFAKRNLVSFDARDIAKNQLEPRDITFLSKANTDASDINVFENKLYGTKKRSYQKCESVKLIVKHKKDIDENQSGARSRSIDSIFIEREDGERYRFPYPTLSGARAMARHISEGGIPYDDNGQHIINMVKEIRDLTKVCRKFSGNESVHEIFESIADYKDYLKSKLKSLSKQNSYSEYFNSLSNSSNTINENEIKSKFGDSWDDTMNEYVNVIGKALVENSIDIKTILSRPLVLVDDPASDDIVFRTRFSTQLDLFKFIMNDISARAVGSNARQLVKFIQSVLDSHEKNPKDLAALIPVAKKYLMDIGKLKSNPEFYQKVRKSIDSKKSVTESKIDYAAVDKILRVMPPSVRTISDVYRFVKIYSEKTGIDFGNSIDHICQKNIDIQNIKESAVITAQSQIKPNSKDPKSITKTELAKNGIMATDDPKTGALTVPKNTPKMKVQNIVNRISQKSKGVVTPSVVVNSVDADSMLGDLKKLSGID